MTLPHSLFQGPRKFSFLALFFVILVFIIGVISRNSINTIQNNWSAVLAKENQKASLNATNLFTEKEKILLASHRRFFHDLQAALLKNNELPAAANTITADDEVDGLSHCILSRGKNIAWYNTEPLTPARFFPPIHKPGDLYFDEQPLRVNLEMYTQLIHGGDTIFVISALQVEDRVKHKNNTPHVCLQNELEDEAATVAAIDYNPYAEIIPDGRNFTVPLSSDYGNKIGSVTFRKNSLTNEIAGRAKTTAQLQGILFVLAFFVLIGAVYDDYRRIKNPLFQSFAFIFLTCTGRLLMFWLGFPAGILPDAMTEPAGFSSQLGGGIVKSPIEFLLTSLAFLICALHLFGRYKKFYIPSAETGKKSSIWYFLSLPIYVVLFIVSLRGIAASIKSVIVDSTFRYFTDPSIIPSIPRLTMITGSLFVCTSAVLILLLLFQSRLTLRLPAWHKKFRWFAATEMLAVMVAGLIFIYTQGEPLVTPALLISFTFLLYVFFYLASNTKHRSLHVVLGSGVIASIISVALLNYFNTALERDSLKTTISEITRPGADFLHFLTEESLAKAQSSQTLIKALELETANLDPEAYLLWNESALHEERVQSAIYLYNASRQLQGRFIAGITVDETDSPVPLPADARTVHIQQVKANTEDNEVRLTGSAPLMSNNVLLGYISLVVSYRPNNLVENTMPLFLRSTPPLINNILSPAELNIFSLNGSDVAQVTGEFYPTVQQSAAIREGVVNPENEMWSEYMFNGERYVVYAQLAPAGQINCVALREKQLEWSFFNFFKLFTVQVFLIFAIAFISTLVNIIRRGAIFITFRSQLLTAFLFISILPLIAMAAYNRYNSSEKNQFAMHGSLQAQTGTLEKQLKNAFESEGNLQKAVRVVYHQTGLYFTLYETDHVAASSAWNVYNAGILPASLPPLANYNLNTAGLNEYFGTMQNEQTDYYAWYRKINLGSKSYILEANSLMNKIPGIYSSVDVDVFIFGVYSLAILLIIGLSSLISNRIAMPIRQLTFATRAVAHGDLNVKLQTSGQGELQDLMNGFNTMTDELMRNQAELANLEREAAWKEFARQVAHEIKNPLTPMKLTMQQLAAAYRDKSPQFDAIFDKVTNTILHQIETLNTIASEFSHFARMPVMHIEKIDLIPILTETFTLFQNEKISLQINAGLPESIIVEGDASHFRRLFINFIRNSMQAGAANVAFEITMSDKELFIRITDDGAGIPAGYENKIFEANFTTKSSGMGLGLKLSRRFIESLGGTIAIEPGSEKGAAFLIVIPILQTDNTRRI